MHLKSRSKLSIDVLVVEWNHIVQVLYKQISQSKSRKDTTLVAASACTSKGSTCDSIDREIQPAQPTQTYVDHWRGLYYYNVTSLSHNSIMPDCGIHTKDSVNYKIACKVS